jgi:hypothetical protein
MMVEIQGHGCDRANPRFPLEWYIVAPFLNNKNWRQKRPGEIRPRESPPVNVGRVDMISLKTS